MSLPEPRTEFGVGHLSRWGRDPLALIEEGAQLGPLFGLRLWRPAVLGYSADWNRFVLSDIKTFRSKGSMSDLSPYLNAGVVQLDAPHHRRQQLNPAFTHGSVRTLTGQIREVVLCCLPSGPFDAVAWSAALMREILQVTLLNGRVRPGLLARDCIAHAPAGPLASAFRDLPDGPQELRVALSAGYDTTAHTLAWLLGHVAQQPELLAIEGHSAVINGHRIRRGTLVLYSPYLTHRDPRLWTDPLSLGRSFAQLVLSTVLDVMAGSSLRFTAGSMCPRTGITLRPAGPLYLSGYGDAGHVALTFDDGPDPACTPALLSVLAEWNVHATFFMLGSMAAAAPGLAREVTAAGSGTVLLHDSDQQARPGSAQAARAAIPALLTECSRLGLAVGTVAEHGAG